jgi:hypothetical protein
MTCSSAPTQIDPLRQCSDHLAKNKEQGISAEERIVMKASLLLFINRGDFAEWLNREGGVQFSVLTAMA